MHRARKVCNLLKAKLLQSPYACRAALAARPFILAALTSRSYRAPFATTGTRVGSGGDGAMVRGAGVPANFSFAPAHPGTNFVPSPFMSSLSHVVFERAPLTPRGCR